MARNALKISPRAGSPALGSGRLRGVSSTALFVISALAYLAAIFAGAAAIPTETGFAIIWPGSAIIGALAYIMPGRRHIVLMAAFAAAFLAKMLLGAGVWEIVTFSAISVLGPLVFCGTLSQFVSPEDYTSRIDSLFLLLLSAIVACLLSGLAGAGALHVFYGSPFAERFLQWLMGEAVAIAAIAPVVINLNFADDKTIRSRRSVEGWLYVATLVGISLSTFRVAQADPVFALPIVTWIAFPVLLLATTRGSTLHGSVSLAILAAVGTVFLAGYEGAFAGDDAIQGEVVLFQVFVLAAAAGMAVVGLYERDRENVAVTKKERQILESVTDFVVALDMRTGSITFANKQAEALISSGAFDEFMSRDTKTSRLMSGPVLAMARHASASGQPHRETVWATAVRRWFEIVIYPSGDIVTLYARDVSEQKEAQEQVQLLAREMNHRVKNFFAVANAIVNASARGADTADAMRRTVADRFAALHRCYEVTRSGEASGDSSLLALVAAFMQPYSGDCDRIEFGGPDRSFPFHAVTTFTLVLHEMTTNSVKYGALSCPDGRLSFTWAENEDGKNLVFTWKETGVPGLTAPTKIGFGTKMIEQSIRQMEATIAYEWGNDGMTARITMPALPERPAC